MAAAADGRAGRISLLMRRTAGAGSGCAIVRGWSPGKSWNGGSGGLGKERGKLERTDGERRETILHSLCDVGSSDGEVERTRGYEVRRNVGQLISNK